jgi:hypothetical protein
MDKPDHNCLEFEHLPKCCLCDRQRNERIQQLELELTSSVNALQIIRQNRKRPNDWEASVIDKALNYIKNPNNYDVSHTKQYRQLKTDYQRLRELLFEEMAKGRYVGVPTKDINQKIEQALKKEDK